MTRPDPAWGLAPLGPCQSPRLIQVAAAGHKEPRWEAVDGQSHHTHDVPCLLLVHGQQGPPQLVSGSLDSRIYAVPAARFLKVGDTSAIGHC